MSIRIDLPNLAELDAKLKALPDNVQKRIGSRALKNAALNCAQVAKANCPRKSGQLLASITIRKKRSRRYKGACYSVRCGAGMFKGDTFYGGFLEYGYLHGSRKLGPMRKFIPAKPFLRPAFDATRSSNIAMIQKNVAEGIDKYMAKKGIPQGT